MRRIAVLAIFLLAFFVRFYALGSVPPSLNADEVAIGYNAYSILKTEKDEFGSRFPLVFRSFDDYKMPVYVYLTVPSIAVFGLTDFAVRFPSAFFGVLSVLCTYFLVKELFKKSKNVKFKLEYFPLLAAFFLAISPWHIQFSRSAYEANVALFFIIFGVFLLLKGVKSGQYLIPGIISVTLSIWTYHSSRVFVPLLGIGFIAIYWKELWKQKKYVCFSGIVGICIVLPLLLMSFSKEGQMRAMGVSILVNAQIPQRFNRWLADDYVTHSVPKFVATSIHNRRFAYIPAIIKGYLEHYSPNYFFSEVVLEKYHAPGVGLLYLWELPFVLYGIFVLIKLFHTESGSKLFLWWFLIAPVAASVTEQLPHPVRTLVFLPTFQVFTAVGVLSYIEKLRTQKSLIRVSGYISLLLIIGLSLLFYLHQYFIHLPIEYSSAWQYGRKEAIEEVKKIQSEYDEIIVSTALDVPHIFFLYYLRYDPATYMREGGTVSGGFNEDRNTFGKYSFRPIKSLKILDKKILYVGMNFEIPKGASIIKTIYYKNGSEAFYLFTLPSMPKAENIRIEK